jgi:hypothetical protein
VGVELARNDEHAAVVRRHLRHRHPHRQRLGRPVRLPPVAVRAVPAASNVTLAAGAAEGAERFVRGARVEGRADRCGSAKLVPA